MTDARRLYHFTCDHGQRGIASDMVVKPHWHPLLGHHLAWFTDDPTPTRDDVGLTSTILHCDRMTYRVVVAAVPPVVRWRDWAALARIPLHVVSHLGMGRDTSTWWVSETPVAVAGIYRTNAQLRLVTS